MSKSKALVCLLFSAAVFPSLSFAVTPDRITGDLASGPKVQISGNVHGLARPENDLGRAESSRVMEHILLSFHPSPSQQKDLDQFLAQLGDRSSKNYHKYLTPALFAARFGMSQNDLQKVIAWLQSQGFTNIKVGHTGNEISFDGTVAQVESTFSLEMHEYLVDGQVYLSNAGNPSVPAAIASSVIGVHNLNGFAPKPRMKVRPNLTSYVSGNHFLTPADFVTIYGLTGLYSAGITGSGQKIAIVGQSTVSTTDLNNFRSAAGLAASTVTMTLVGGTATRCSGDEGESDLDLEWAGGVARDASIIFLYAGLGTGDVCGGNRNNSVWNALDQALTTAVAPFVSTSYGFCESGLGTAFAGVNGTLEQWIKAGQASGVTLVSASGDAGAADCDPSNSTSASGGLAVDSPASIPETTAAGGNEFTGDASQCPSTGCTTSTGPADLPYWGPSNAGSDAISTALEHIPEEAWNDTTENLSANPPGGLAASGGGVSIFFLTTPSWQNVTGVPSPGKGRYVPDISLSASADHDGYLVCSEDSSTGSCVSGFRDSAGGNFAVVGGTSAVAPTFSAIMALINQYLGNTPPTGLAPINPTLYTLYNSNSTSKAFNDINSGNNIVPCTQGTTGCPATAPFQYGFTTNAGYDEVTGLGSVNGFNLAQAWAATLGSFTLSPSPSSLTAIAGQSSNSTTITITPVNNFSGTVTFSCSAGLPAGATCTFTPVNSTSSTLVIQTGADVAAVSNASITVKGTSGATSSTTTVTLAVTATTESFSLKTNLSGGTLSVAQGQTSGAVNLTVTSTSNPSFIVSSGSGQQTALPVTYTCSGLPSESTCSFNGTANTITSSQTSVTLTIQTTAPTTRLQLPLDRGSRFFYAALLPGLLGIVVTVSSRKRALRGMRVLGLIIMLGFSTLWLASCGGTSSSSNKNPGTPTGNSTITVKAVTSGGGAAPITASPALRFTLTVTP